MQTIYKNSVVAFVDLLGFKEALKNEMNAHLILDILHQIKHGESTSCTANTQLNGSAIEIRIKPSVSVFSDNIAISVSDEIFNDTVSWRHAVIEILNMIQQLANLVIQKGFLLRGGITMGSLYHRNGIVFGPGLSEAYELESKHAIYPRILANTLLVEKFNSDSNGGTHNCFVQDNDGNYYLDYLPTALTYSSANKSYSEVIQQTILTLMKKAASDNRCQRILEKWFWFEKYHNQSLEKIMAP